MSNLIIANITRRPTRTLVSILAVALGVVLVLTAVGVSHGLLNDAADRTKSMGADIIFQPTGASLLFALNTGTMPLKIVNELMKEPEVGLASPAMLYFSTKDFGLVFGIDQKTFNQFPGRLQIISGTDLVEKYDAVVDDTFAKVHKLKVGDLMDILGDQKFRVSGICRSGIAIVRVFVKLSTMQEVKGAPNQISMVFLKCKPGTATAQLFQTLRSGRFAGYTITKSEDIFSMMSANLPGLEEFTLTVVTTSALVSFLVVLLAMYTTILERTREIGILKSLGASRLFIVNAILKESLVICVLGILVGISLSFLARKLITMNFPTMQVDISTDWLLKAGLLGLVSGTLGALYPACKAARQDPVQALMYE
ncbi:MAG: ABC transporter permease [Acidobacteria bacterium]|nr:ABC transporter permease [Acidobacteriota bacterium]MBI3657179.1 ABC transporter permease [Acidobacteriota bacterium]